MRTTSIDGKSVKAPIIKECDMHYECKVIYKQAMEPATIDSEIDGRFYKNNNFHVMFYGEILEAYKK